MERRWGNMGNVGGSTQANPVFFRRWFFTAQFCFGPPLFFYFVYCCLVHFFLWLLRTGRKTTTTNNQLHWQQKKRKYFDQKLPDLSKATHHPPTHPTGWNLFCNCCVFIPSMRVDGDFFGFPAFWALASCLGHCHVNLWQKLASLTKICLLTHYLYKQIDGQQLMGVESVVLVVPLGSMGTVPWGSWVLLTGVLQIHGSGEICMGTAPVDAVISWPLLGEFLS